MASNLVRFLFDYLNISQIELINLNYFDIFKCTSLNNSYCISPKVFLMLCAPRVLIGIQEALFQVMTLRLTRTRSLPELMITWGRLNKKDGLTRYGDSHVKDKTS